MIRARLKVDNTSDQAVHHDKSIFNAKEFNIHYYWICYLPHQRSRGHRILVHTIEQAAVNENDPSQKKQ